MFYNNIGEIHSLTFKKNHYNIFLVLSVILTTGHFLSRISSKMKLISIKKKKEEEKKDEISKI